MEGRPPVQVRTFVQSLTGGEGELYDYLAEEVVGELPSDLRDFLLRVSLLEEIDLGSASVSADVSPAQAKQLLVHAQRLGLLSKGAGPAEYWRPHPLVREYLHARLEVEVGHAGITELHRHLAAVLEPQSWRLAARHWAAAGDADQVRRVVCTSVPRIIGTGDFAAAEEFVTRFPDPGPNPWYDILRSRVCCSRGSYDEALQAARSAMTLNSSLATEDSALSGACASVLLGLRWYIGDVDAEVDPARQLAQSADQELAAIADATALLWEAAEDGSLDRLRDALDRTLATAEGAFEIRGNYPRQPVAPTESPG